MTVHDNWHTRSSGMATSRTCFTGGGGEILPGLPVMSDVRVEMHLRRITVTGP